MLGSRQRIVAKIFQVLKHTVHLSEVNKHTRSAKGTKIRNAALGFANIT